MNRILPVLILLLSVSLSGCLFRRKPVTPPPPPPPLPAPIQPARPDLMPPPGVEPPAPSLLVEGPAVTPGKQLPPAPAARPQPRRRSNRPAPPPASAPKPAPPEEPLVPAPAPASAPQLGEVITPALRAELRRAFDEANSQARQTLARLEGRKLSGEQAQTAARVRAFLAQAEPLLESDPRSAAELARRAALLARDLAGSVR